MYYGTTIDELIEAVKKAEQDIHKPSVNATPVRVTRYAVNTGFVYAMQFAEPAAVMGVA